MTLVHSSSFSMLEEKPGDIARVIRIKADEKPPSGFSWKDYDNVELEESGTTSVNDEDEDSGWDVVKSKRPSMLTWIA